MRANYDYYYTRQAVGNIDIEDIGNCCIASNNDNGDFYYLIISTQYGITQVIEYGPYNDNVTPDFITSLYNRFDYNETRIDKMIEKFLNQPKRSITQAMIVEFEDIQDRIINFIDIMKED